MTRPLSLFLLLLAVAMFAACGDKPADPVTPAGDANGHPDSGDHDSGEDHDDHDHGERVELGESKAGAHTVTLALFGPIEAGQEAVLDIDVEGAAAETVRAWVGIESGRGSLKAKVEGEDGSYHGHLEVPATLPEGSAIWIELQAADGTRTRTSFPIPTP
jgi:hypothetical protein